MLVLYLLMVGKIIKLLACSGYHRKNIPILDSRKLILLLYITIVISMFSTCSSVPVEIIDDTYFKNNKPFTGIYLEKYENGNIQIRGDVLSGMADGLWQWYYENQSLEISGYYSQGKRHGQWTWYDKKGIMQKREYYEQGSPIGKWDEYYPGGSLKFEIIYHSPTKRTHISWFENGQVEYRQHYTKQDVFLLDGTTEEFYSNGIKRFETTFEMGKIAGYQRWWFENGQVMLEGLNDHGTYTGKWIKYYENGKIQAQTESPSIHWVYQWIPLK